MRHYCHWIITVAISLLPGLALADGLVLAPAGDTIRETGQKAVLVYDAATERETLMVSITYKGSADDFIWMIPTPSEPTVGRGWHNLITSIEDEINPWKRSSSINYYDDRFGQVDYTTATVLPPTSSADIVAWLAAKGYTFPADSTYMLDDYVAQGWYFTILTIHNTPDADIAQTLDKGDQTAVQLDFTTKKIVYPLRMSGIAHDPKYKDGRPVLLYIFNQDKVAVNETALLPPFHVAYADWVKGKVIENLATSSLGEPWIDLTARKYFLTTFNVSFRPWEITGDLFFQADDNNTIVNDNAVHWERREIVNGLLAMLFGMTAGISLATFSPFGLVAIAATVVRSRARTVRWRRVAHGLQWFMFVMVLVVSLELIRRFFQEMSVPELIDNWIFSSVKNRLYPPLSVLSALGFVNVVFLALPLVHTRLLRRRNQAPIR